MPKTLLALILLCALSVLAQSKDSTPQFHVAQTFQIGGDGGWDYLTVDSDHHLLYVPRSTHTMILDESTGKTIADIPGQSRNHGVAIVPDLHRGFITDGKDESVTIFDTQTNKPLGKIKAAVDADGIIYDPATKHLFISCGDAAAVIPVPADVDPASGKADPAIDLGGKPEFLASDNNGKLFVNLQDKNQVAVIDTKAMKLLDKWPVAPGGSPVGMAIDRDHHRLFIGCRNPQKLIVMSSDDGKVIADLPIGAGVDAVQFDEGNIFASCRDGTLAVVRETSPGKFEITQTVPTKPGARTMGLDPTTHTLYLPTAEFDPPTSRTAKPNSFMILQVSR